MFLKVFLINLFRASGEAILGTLKYLPMAFYTAFIHKKFSRLRRGDFRYTTIPLYSAVVLSLFRASGEAILDTQRCLDDRFCNIRKILCVFLSRNTIKAMVFQHFCSENTIKAMVFQHFAYFRKSAQ